MPPCPSDVAPALALDAPKRTSAQRARDEGDRAAFDQLAPDVVKLFGTADGAEGMQSFIERRKAVFTGN